jgi:acetyl esterase/lipase
VSRAPELSLSKIKILQHSGRYVLPALQISGDCLMVRSSIAVSVLVGAVHIAPAELHAQSTPATLVRWEEVNRDPPHPDARIHYGADTLMFGDLRIPQGVERPPLVVVIHGGCWRAENDLRHVSHLSAALRDDGIATWTIEYRRVGNPGGGWPGTFEDVVAAVNFVRELTDKHGLKAEQISLLGHSAGGQLALWLAAHAENSEAKVSVPDLKVSIASVVALAPITDLRTFSGGIDYCNRAVAPYLGGTPDEVPDRFVFASPSELPTPSVPIYLVHGERDPYVPLSQSTTYRSGAAASRRQVTLELIEEAGHFDLIAPFSTAWPRVLGVIRSAVGNR